jgi:SAM-dependent methyltransferase
MPQGGFDPGRLQAFMMEVMDDLSGAMTGIMCALGDRLGLFAALAAGGPATSIELAARANLDERYTREWLAAMSSAGYLGYDPASGQYTLPPEHAAVLAQEGGMLFLGGAFQQLLGLFGPLDALMEAFRNGAGLPESAYPVHLLQGMERISAGWLEHHLVQHWVPAYTGLAEALTRGVDVADVGCGSGQALIVLARAFPLSRFIGYDLSADAVARARENAEEAGVADRVRFEQRDILDGLPDAYDLVMTLDALHDFPDPGRVLGIVRSALRPDGTYMLMDIRTSERPEENRGPIASILYGTSLLYCLPTSRANGGAGLGTMGLPESAVLELCRAAGFGTARRLPIENPFNVLYEVKP